MPDLGTGLDLGDDARGRGRFDDVMSAVVLAGNAIQGLDVETVCGTRTGGSSSAPQVAQWAMVLTSRRFVLVARIVTSSPVNSVRCPGGMVQDGKPSWPR